MSEPELVPYADEALDDARGFDWMLAAKKAGAVSMLAGTTFVGGFLAADMMPTDVALGPHDGTVQLTAANQATLDLGPIGSVSTKSPVPSWIGAGGIKITLREIPDGDGTTLGAGEIKQYEQFFTEPGRDALVQTVEDALIHRGLEGGGIAAGGALLSYWLLQARGREAIGEALRSRRLRATGMVMASMVMLAGSNHVEAQPAPPENAVLASLGVHGIRVDGKVLETVIDKYGPAAIKYIKELDAYYDGIDKNLFDALKLKEKQEKDNPTPLTEKIADGSAEQALWISDNHCNTETAGIAADVARHIKATFVLDSGDQTMGGTAAERLCVAILPQRLGGEVPIVVSLGNHDSRDVTARMDKELGYVVLDGRVTKVKGYTFVGDGDVNRSEFNVPFRQLGPESTAEESKRIAEVACKNGDVDIVMAHEPEAGIESARGNCARLVISGHTHIASGPDKFLSEDRDKLTYRMVNGTTGGAAPDKMTFESKLGKDATMIVLIFDKETKQPIGYRNIVLHPNQSVSISDAIELEQLPKKQPEPGSSESAVPSPEPSATD